MVSFACKLLVKEELNKLGLHCVSVELDEVEIHETINNSEMEQLKKALSKWGFELMDGKRNILTEKIKNLIIGMVQYSEEMPKINFSNYLSEKLNHNYTYLSNLFSEQVGTTIEHYIILQKIERVKELLVYDELCLSEIAFKMHYSSVAHLSTQFKNITGITVSDFRELEHKQLFELESIGVA